MFRQLLLLSLLAAASFAQGQQQDDYETDDYTINFDQMQGDTNQLVPQPADGSGGGSNMPLDGFENNQQVFDPMTDDEDFDDDVMDGSGEQATDTIPLRPNNKDPLEPGEIETDNDITEESKNSNIPIVPATEETQTMEIEPYNPNEEIFETEIETTNNSDSEDDDANDDDEDSESSEEDKKPKQASGGIGFPVPQWIDNFWGERWFVAALLGGAIVGFLIIVIVIIFICHAVRKKDEGSYVLDKGYKQGSEAPRPNGNSEYLCWE